MLNDTFDVYKDTQSGIYTIPIKSSSALGFQAFYSERISAWMQLEIPAKQKRKLKAQFALPFATGFVCLRQYVELEKSYGDFNPKSLSRKELVCDMDSIPKVMETMKSARIVLSGN